MTGLHCRLGIPIFTARFAVEASVFLIGWLLGGTVGPATLAVALGVGPLVGVALSRLQVRPDPAACVRLRRTRYRHALPIPGPLAWG